MLVFTLALRGYRTTNQGNPDESRASRYILKDYVQGKLLFIHPPPACSFSERDFNLKNEYKASRLLHVDLTLTQAPVSSAPMLLNTIEQPSTAALMHVSLFGVLEGPRHVRVGHGLF